VAVEFDGWRYAGGKVFLNPSTSGSTIQALPTTTDGNTAKFVFVGVRNSIAANSFNPCAAVRFFPAGSSTSSAATTDFLVTSNEGHIFAVQGYDFVSAISITLGGVVNVSAVEW